VTVYYYTLRVSPPATGASAPRLGYGYAALWGRLKTCAPIGNRRFQTRVAAQRGRLATGQQDTILPHKTEQSKTGTGEAQ
jgi:hypothetical protein